MKISLTFKYFAIFLLLIASIISVRQVSADYLDEFSILGRQCTYIDQFFYEDAYGNTKDTAIISCCDLDTCFYVPENLNKSEIVSRSYFDNILMVESARQNIDYYNLTSNTYIFEKFFDVCEAMDVESPTNQLIAGGSEAVEKTSKYMLNAKRATKVVRTIKVLKAAQIISKFDPPALLLSLSCSQGNNVDKKVNTILSQCYNNFGMLQKGYTKYNNIQEINTCTFNLKEEAKQPEGLIENFNEITYFVSSLLTGGNVIEFIRHRQAEFDRYNLLVSEDVLNIPVSNIVFDSYAVDIKPLREQLDSISTIMSKNIPWWRQLINWFIVLFNPNGMDSQYKEIYMFNQALKDIDKASKEYKYKTVHKMLDNAFDEAQRIILKQNREKILKDYSIDCFNISKPYRYISTENRTFWNFYNRSELRAGNRQPELSYFGISLKKGQLNCQDAECSVIFHIVNDGYPVQADIEVNLSMFSPWDDGHYLGHPNSTYNTTLKFKDEVIESGIYEFKTKIPNFNNLSIFTITGFNHTIIPKENEFYKWTNILNVNFTDGFVDVNSTGYEYWRYCNLTLK
jgi:hypothetical protein